MKINRLVSAIFFFVVGLFSLASLQAQEAKTLFVNIPDSLTPLLTKVNREDCIDFLESKMKAQVENRFGKKSEMTELGTDYVRMQMSPQTSWQMKVLALSDTTKVVCLSLLLVLRHVIAVCVSIRPIGNHLQILSLSLYR